MLKELLFIKDPVKGKQASSHFKEDIHSTCNLMRGKTCDQNMFNTPTKKPY